MNKEPQLISKSSQNEEKQINKNIKKWQNLHKFRYLLFLLVYQADLQKNFDIVPKISWHFKLSQFIQNVSPVQCGEYHMNRLSEHGSIQGIIDYLISTVLILKQQFTQEKQRVKQIILKDPYFPKKQNKTSNQNENKIQTIKFQQLIPDINSQASSEQQPNNQNFYKEITPISQIFAEGMIIIQRNEPFRYSNLKKQEQKIQKIISIYKNFQPQVNDFIKFKSYCLDIMIKMSKQQKSQRSTKVILGDLLNDRSSQIACSDQEGNSNRQQNQENENKPINSQKNLPRYKKEVLWDNKQGMELITFLNIVKIVKEEYKTEDNFLYKKCSQYLNSDKSPNECKLKISQLCQKYSGKYQKMLQNETIRLQISQQMIEKKKQEYIMKEKNPLRCEIKIQFQPIKITKQKSNSIIKMQKKVKLELKTPAAVKFEFQPHQPQNEQLQKINKKQNDKIEKPKIKYFLHLKVSNKIFTIIKNSAKDEIPFQQSNFIILIKKSHIKPTIQSIENKEDKLNQQKVCQISQKYKVSQFIEKQFAINNINCMKYNNLIIPITIFPKRQIEQKFENIQLKQESMKITEEEKIRRHLKLFQNMSSQLQEVQKQLAVIDENKNIVDQLYVVSHNNKKVSKKKIRLQQKNFVCKNFRKSLMYYHSQLQNIEGQDVRKIYIKTFILYCKCNSQYDSFTSDLFMDLKVCVDDLIQKLKQDLTKIRIKHDLQFQNDYNHFTSIKKQKRQ